MTPTLEVITLSAALLMGLMGSAHCFGMCSGFASALGMRIRQAHGSPNVSAYAALYQLGRIAGYSLLGALCGAFGHVLKSILDLARVGELLRVVSGVLLLLVAARLLFRFNGLAGVERVGGRLWKFLQPLTLRLTGSSLAHTVLLGMIWGLLPCGMVYSMLAFAGLSGSAVHGAFMLAVFGLGTLPSMFLSTLIAAKSLRTINAPWIRQASGVVLVGLAIVLITAPFHTPEQDHHAGHITTTAAASP